MNGTEIVLLVLLLLAILTVSKGIRTVPQGEVWTVERFGAFTRLLQPGLNLVIPFIDQVGTPAERAGGGARHPRAIRHHPRQRLGPGRRHRLLPRHGPGQGGLCGAADGTSLDRAGDDQHPRRHRRDGPRPDAEQPGAHQLLPARHPRRRDRPLGHQGQPGRAPQGGAAGEPGARHEPADDRRARAPRHGDAGGGRQAGADPRRRGPPGSRPARRPGARTPGPGRGHGDADGERGGMPAPARPRCATSSPRNT